MALEIERLYMEREDKLSKDMNEYYERLMFVPV